MTQHINVADFGIVPETDCYDEWRAAMAVARAHYDATNERTYLHIQTPGTYYSQYHSGNGNPYSGTGVQLASGAHIVGSPGVLLRNLPAALGGVAGQVVGVRAWSLDTRNVGIHNLSVLNDGVSGGNPSNHAIWFNSTTGALIEGIELENVRILGAASGDGAYFGARVSDVTFRRGSVQGCSRHGVTLAGLGEGRTNYLFEDIDMGAPTVFGSAFHIESDFDVEAGYALLAADPAASPVALAAAMKCIQGVTLRRCHFAGGYLFNGVANWLVTECTSRPPLGGAGGYLTVVNSPGGRVERTTSTAMNQDAGSFYRMIRLVGGLVSGLDFDGCLFDWLGGLDGSAPTAISTREYTAGRPGLPRGVSFSNVRLVTPPGGVAVAGEGDGWDLSGLRHAQ